MINEIGKSINKIINTGIRLNPNIDGNMLDKISTGKNTDKFGITVKDLNDIVLRIKDLKNIKIVGISCHVGSQIRNLNAFKKIFQFMKKTAKELINKKIDIAVHALKDLPSIETESLITNCFLERNDPREILISKNNLYFQKLKKDSIVGTSSFRREFQLKRIRSDLKYKLIRGNAVSYTHLTLPTTPYV